MRRAFGLWVLLGLLCGCGTSRSREGQRPVAGDEAGASTQGGGVAQGRAVVRGTTIEASTGRPLGQVLVEGPGELRTTSDRDGHFELRGLPVGVAGELLATAPDGRTGRNVLRELRAGVLEVVLFVR